MLTNSAYYEETQAVKGTQFNTELCYGFLVVTMDR